MTPSLFGRLPTRRVAGRARRSQLLERFATGGTLWPDAAHCGWIDVTSNVEKPGPKVLLVVAHPDDESECAATIYRITHELKGVVDQAIVTDGAAGFHWAHAAESLYGLSLADEDVARRHLPRIRRNEVLKANRILGVRDTYFFDQPDTGFTLDAADGLQTWNCDLVRATLTRLIDREQYDFIFTLLPTDNTHGHHKSVAIVLLQAVVELERDRRPAVLGVKTKGADERVADCYDYLSGYNLTKATSATSIWQFDRATTIEGSGLQYSIIANWVVAEHKSQGMFQMELGRRRFEQFWLFEVSGTRGITIWDRSIGSLEKTRFNNAEERTTAYA